MARTLWCRYEDCGKPDDSFAGEQKATCPACGRDARWTTDPNGLRERRKHAKRPRVKFDLTENDYRLFLKRIKIAAD